MNVVERREGRKGLLFALDTVSCLCCALPEPRHADLYSEHPPNKCQSTKGENERFALGTLSYTEKGTAFVCLFKVELTSLGSWPRGTCDHAVLKLSFSTHRRNAQHKSIEKAVLHQSGSSAVPHALVPAEWWLPLAVTMLNCSTCTPAPWERSLQVLHSYPGWIQVPSFSASPLSCTPRGTTAEIGT